MLSRNLKAAYYGMMYIPMRVNALRHRLLTSYAQPQKIHLGPGQGNYLNGWVNVDANFLTARIDLWADIGGKLPFGSGTVVAFYSHHVIEHLPDAALAFHFSEMERCLIPGGAIRVGGPNAEVAMRKFLDNDANWFSDFSDKRSSIGGRFANFILCRGEHLAILTSSYLEELAINAGFRDVRFCRPRSETRFPLIFDEQVLAKEWEPTPEFPHTILMEAIKRPY